MADDGNDGGSGRLWRLSSEEILGPASPVRGQIARLLGDKRYEEALDLLYATRWQAPDAVEISRGINLLKERLVRGYLERLGNLDAVPKVVQALETALPGIGEEERTLLHLVDGISSFSDIVHQSRLGRFETYRALSRFVSAGLIVAGPPPAADPRLTPRRSSAASVPAIPVSPPARRRRTPLVGLVTLALAGALGGGWWLLGRTAEPPFRAAPVAAVAVAEVPPDQAAAADPLPPNAAPPAGMPLADEQPKTVADEVKVPSTPALERPSGARGLAPGSAGALRASRRLAVRPSRRGTPAPGAPTPAAAAAAAAPAASTADERGAPGLPELYADGEAAFDAAAVTALRTGAADPDRPRQAPAAASHAPVKGPAPVGLAGSSSPALFVPAPVSVVTKEILVRGPLARSVVEHAIARAEADFHACYSAAVASARRDAAGTARVQLTIDEGGYAGAVSVKGGPLPGMDRCVQEVARQIRTRVPPDVGLATVSFTVVFSVGGPAR